MNFLIPDNAEKEIWNYNWDADEENYGDYSINTPNNAPALFISLDFLQIVEKKNSHFQLKGLP